MKKWQLGWQLMTQVQKTVFIALIVCAVLSLALPETPYLLRMAGLGAIGAWLVVRPRRGRPSLRPGITAHPPPSRAPGGMGGIMASQTSAPRAPRAPRVLTEEERERSLHSSAGAQGLRLVEGKLDRAGALAQMRKTVDGFPHTRYEAALDAALASIEVAQVDVRVRRAKMIGEARKMDPLNAVFALYYFNSRRSRHPQEAGLGSINLDEALGDLYAHEQIEAAKARCSDLIEEGWSCAYYPDDNGRQVQQLREHHPGFTDAHLHRAADWGYFNNR